MSSRDTNDLFAQITAKIKAKDDISFHGIIEQLERLQALAKIHSQLVPTAHILRNRPKDLPRGQAARLKEMIKFAYGDRKYKEDVKRTLSVEARRACLRQLDCNALKFCGLTFMIRDMLKLPDLEFELLVEHVTEFVHSRGLIEHLYSDEITKALVSEMISANDQRTQEHQEFLIGNFNRADLGLMD
ncbi:hypothetical protein PMIN06_010472 [Paraphaeosphaeria minitans]